MGESLGWAECRSFLYISLRSRIQRSLRYGRGSSSAEVEIGGGGGDVVAGCFANDFAEAVAALGRVEDQGGFDAVALQLCEAGGSEGEIHHGLAAGDVGARGILQDGHEGELLETAALLREELEGAGVHLDFDVNGEAAGLFDSADGVEGGRQFGDALLGGGDAVEALLDGFLANGGGEIAGAGFDVAVAGGGEADLERMVGVVGRARGREAEQVGIFGRRGGGADPSDDVVVVVEEAAAGGSGEIGHELLEKQLARTGVVSVAQSAGVDGVDRDAPAQSGVDDRAGLLIDAVQKHAGRQQEENPAAGAGSAGEVADDQSQDFERGVCGHAELGPEHLGGVLDSERLAGGAVLVTWIGWGRAVAGDGAQDGGGLDVGVEVTGDGESFELTERRADGDGARATRGVEVKAGEGVGEGGAVRSEIDDLGAGGGKDADEVGGLERRIQKAGGGIAGILKIGGGSVGVVEEEGDGAGSGRVRRGGLRGSVRVKDGDGLTLAAIKELEVFLAESGDCLILRVANGDGEFDEIGLGGEREGGR